MSPQPKNDQPAAAELAPGQHNPFLQGLIHKGEETEKSIKGWYEERDRIRRQCRDAVASGFCSDEQKATVADMYPMPKRTKKSDTATTANAA